MRSRSSISAWLLVFLATPALGAEVVLTIPRPLGGAYLEYFGRTVANVGDQNADGYDDFLVGMPAAYLNNTNDVGHAFLYYGGNPPDGQYDLVMAGQGAQAKLGYSVTSLGDFNADGFEDFAVGQPGCTGTIDSKVHVFFGGPLLDAQADLLLVEADHCTWLGWSVSGGRDLNGDGYPDLAASANYDDTGIANTGRVYVYFGGPGVDDQPDLVLDGLPGEEHFGVDVDLVQDVTGDGYDDLLVVGGSPGRVVVFAGGPGLDAVADWTVDLPNGTDGKVAGGDVDGDGSGDVLVGLPQAGTAGQVYVFRGGPALDATADLLLEGRKAGEGFGRMLEAPGDVDGDGIRDIVVGSVGAGADYLRGFLYVYRGGDLTNTRLELAMGGPEYNVRFAAAAASLGDIDGDGADELLIGSLSPWGYAWVVDELFFDCDDDGRSDLEQVGNGELEDCDQDGVPDLCQIALWADEDCNGNTLPDACDIASMPELDCDQSGGIDVCEIANDPSLDCDGDGSVDTCQLAAMPELDCDQSGGIDVCEIANDPSLDCDGDGSVDTCQLLTMPGLDCDGSGGIDACEIAADPSVDCDGDGWLDTCQLLAMPGLDCDGSGGIDVCEIAADPSVDCDADGGLDTCQLSAMPELDCNDDGEIDVCSIASDPSADCDRNGQLDVCDIASIEDWDCDEDGVFDRCEITLQPGKDAGQDGVLDACQVPGELALYADAGHTRHNLLVTSAGVVGPFELVLHVPAGTALVQHVELTIQASPQAPLIDLELLVPGATDIDATEAGVVASWPALAPDTQGDLLLARAWCLVSSPPPQSQEIRIVANASAFHDPDFGLPLWVDGTGDPFVVTTTFSGWINRTFADCNENGRADSDDIALGSSLDLNMNGIPDECEATDAPPESPSYTLQIDAHPNPFNPATTLRLELPAAGPARVDVVDLQGRRVRTFAIEAAAPGPREILWRGTDDTGREVASGVYIVRVVQGSRSAQRKLVLLR